MEEKEHRSQLLHESDYTHFDYDPMINESPENENEFLPQQNIISERNQPENPIKKKKSNKFPKKRTIYHKKSVNEDENERYSFGTDLKIQIEKEEEENLDDLEKELNKLNKINFKEAFRQFQKFLEVDHPTKYRDKMKGFIVIHNESMEPPLELWTKDEIKKVQEKVAKVQQIMNEKRKLASEEKKSKRKIEYILMDKNEFLNKNRPG